MIIDRPDDPLNYVQPGTGTDWLSQISNPALVKALQDASKSSVFSPPAAPTLGAAPTGSVPAGRPMRPGALDQLAQLLEKQRAQYGGLSGQPVQRSQILGLLGF